MSGETIEVATNEAMEDVVMDVVASPSSKEIHHEKRTSTMNATIIPPRTYKPYQTTTLETPLWHLILEPLCLNCLKPMLSLLYRLRGMLADPMRINIVPRVLAGILPSSSVGDLILAVPIIVFVLRGAHYTFISPSLDLSGYMAAYCIFLAYLTASKSNSIFTWLFGIPYERLIGLHWFSSVAGGVLGAFHCYVSYNYGGDDEGDSVYSKANNDVVVFVTTSEDQHDHDHADDDPNLIKFLFDGQTNWSGTILLVAMVGMVLMSFFQFLRRNAFNVWYVLHVVFGIAIVVMLFLHSARSAVFVAAWWILDLLVRYGVMAGLKNKTRAKLRIIGSKKRANMQPYEPAVELIVKKPFGFQYNAGQFVRLAVPALSSVEFHPISISSAPDEPYILLQVRRLGDWTDRLVELAETTEYTDVLLEGPYGAMSIDLEDDEKYKLVLFVSGGIGVTPCQSIGKHLLLKHRQEGRRLKKLKFVWAVRDLQMVEDIPPLLLGTIPQPTSTTKGNNSAIGHTDDTTIPNTTNMKENYSTSSPEFQRMMDRSDYFKSSSFDKSLRMSTRSSSVWGLDSSIHGSSRSVNGTKKLRRRPAVVQADIYCTQQRLPEVDGDDDDVEGANRVPARNLPYNLYRGRPNFDEIFEELKASAEVLGESNIAVIGCGPTSLMAALQEACRKHSSSIVGGCMAEKSVFFDLHKEHFEL